MPGPIQIIYSIFFVAFLVVYLRFMIDLFKSQLNAITMLMWLIVAFVLPLVGVVIYYGLKDRIEVKMT